MNNDQELVEKLKEICLQELDCDYTAEHIFYFCEQYFRQHDMQMAIEAVEQDSMKRYGGILRPTEVAIEAIRERFSDE